MIGQGLRWLVGGGAWMLMATLPLAAQTPAGTAFSYQGRLTDGGAPASGLYDLRVTLFDAATGTGTIGAPVVVDDVTVTSGLFTVMLDFGAAAFAGDARWLEIAVRPGAKSGAFTPLASRQMVTPTPHAVFSQSAAVAPWIGVAGKPAGFADDVDNDTLTTLACSTAGHVAKWTGSAWSCALDADATGLDWKLTGNAGTGGAAVLGTTDNQPLTLIVNGVPAMRLFTSPINTFTVSVIGGSSTNTTGTAVGATIAGGGLGFSDANRVTDHFGTVAGGSGNVAGARAFIGGGLRNTATELDAIVVGGESNHATNTGATIVGGLSNDAAGIWGFIGAGSDNAVSGFAPTVGGGNANVASGDFATVPGGQDNQALGEHSFAAGFGARAQHNGAFVWASHSGGLVQSLADDQFVVRALGGIWLGHTGPATLEPTRLIDTSTGAYLTTGGTWTNASDRNLKERFEPIDGTRLLDRLARLPITSWSYKAAPTVRHIGPMAQDFLATFGLGGDDKAISTIDPASIALATIQELHRRLTAAEAHAASQDARIAALEAAVRQLQQAMSSRSTEGVR